MELLRKGSKKINSLRNKDPSPLDDEGDMDFDVTNTPITKYKTRRKLMTQ
jgi:hypothetical protein